MIGREQDHGAVELSAVCQVVDDAADAHVEILHHAGKDLLGSRVAALFLRAQIGPGFGHALEIREARRGRQDAGFPGPLEAPFAQCVVTVVVAPGVAVEPVLR